MEEKTDFFVLEPGDLDALIQGLRGQGAQVWGPTAATGAMALGLIESAQDLPYSHQTQSPGHYRLEEGDAFLGQGPLPGGFKELFSPRRQKLFSAQQSDQGVSFTPEPVPVEAKVLIGLKPCDLAAIHIQDQVYDQETPEPGYQARRQATQTIVLNCTEPAQSCFCTTLGTGPAAATGFDLALTPLGLDRFLAQPGSPAGQAMVEGLATAPTEAVESARNALKAAAAQMPVTFDPKQAQTALKAAPGTRIFEDMNQACLACGSCTLVCPTCFCSGCEDKCDLENQATERWLHWDSCFNLEYSYMHGGSARSEISHRYRQWITHKLSSWQDQFGTAGCVGCGRCVTWCPVGIDLREEATKLQPKEPS